MSFIDDMAAAEARHKRDGFDLQWCPTTESGELDFTYRLNWRPAQVTRANVSVPITIIEGLILCERPSGANAEARHSAEQKSRDRVAAELAQYQTGDSIADVGITRHIGSKEEFAELMDELDRKERRG